MSKNKNAGNPPSKDSKEVHQYIMGGYGSSHDKRKDSSGFESRKFLKPR